MRPERGVEVFSVAKKGPTDGHMSKTEEGEGISVWQDLHGLCQNVILTFHLRVIRHRCRTFNQNETDALIFTYKPVWLRIVLVH